MFANLLPEGNAASDSGLENRRDALPTGSTNRNQSSNGFAALLFCLLLSDLFSGLRENPSASGRKRVAGS